MNVQLKGLVTLCFAATILLVQCKKKEDGTQETPIENPNSQTPPTIGDNTSVRGFNLLSKITGIWNGPITSTTSMGDFPEAPMDFRPISASQVSVMNELDPNNSVFMSFFIAYTGSNYEVVFRNGGTFAGMIRTSYMKLDSLSESPSESYYRFVDYKKGDLRTITEVTFKNDSLRIKAYTNKLNTQPTATVHMDYRAKKQYDVAAQNAITHFNYPQKVMVKNFATAFNDVVEGVFYSTHQDPYPNSEQPYTGKATLSYTVAPSITLNSNARITLMASTEPLISMTGPNTANFKTRSRYIILDQATTSHQFTMMHPGSYYFYALVDNNANNMIDSGDLISVQNTQFTLPVAGNVSQTTQINFQIP